MGLIVQEIMELRQMLKLYNKGKLTTEQIQTQIAIYSQVEKRAKTLLQAMIFAEKNRKSLKEVINSNLLGEHEAIELGIGSAELEKVKCLLTETIITRAECVESSGKKGDYDICKDCDHYAISRQLLLPEGV